MLARHPLKGPAQPRLRCRCLSSLFSRTTKRKASSTATSLQRLRLANALNSFFLACASRPLFLLLVCCSLWLLLPASFSHDLVFSLPGPPASLRGSSFQMALEELCSGDKETGPQYLIAAPRKTQNGEYEVEYLRDPVIEPGQIVVPGSFNPIHEGHEGLATRVVELRMEMGEQAAAGTLFELCITNADKGTQPVEEIHRRAMAVVRRGHRLLITKATLYKAKALLCQGCDFVVGYDTYKRIVNPKYYVPAGKALEDSSTAEQNEWVQGALEELNDNKIRLFVAGRAEDDGSFLDLETAPLYDLPPHLKNMILPVTGFRMDISSTALRAKLAAETGAQAA